MIKKHIEKSSGNVFADIGFRDPVEHRLKADMAIAIDIAIKQSNWSQKEAAKALGTTQNKISDIQRGVLKGFSVYKLFTMLAALHHDVRVVVEPAKADHGMILLQNRVHSQQQRNH